MQQKSFEKEKRRNLEEVEKEKTPEWKVYVDLKGKEDLGTKEHWQKLAQLREEKPEQAIQNAEQAYQMLVNNQFLLEEREDEFEEYDGLNHITAKALIVQVDLPVLVRAHSLDIRVSPEFLRIFLF